MTPADHVLTEAVRALLHPGEVVYLHGLEGSPQGTRGTWIQQRLGGMGVDLDTSVARQVLGDVRSLGLPLDPGGSDLERAFAVPMERARERLRQAPSPQLLVGASFGGAVLLKLMDEGSWRGPALFLAGAGAALTPIQSLPESSRALFIHCPEDDTVPVQGSRSLAGTGGPNVHLLEISDGDDPHRLPGILSSGVLAAAVAWLLEPLASARPERVASFD